MPWTVTQRDDQIPHGKATLIVTGCPRGACRMSLWANAPVENGNVHMWQWNGSVEAATISPSINCQEPGCHRHFIVNNGKAEPECP